MGFISDIDTSLPGVGDNAGQGDDQIRTLKSDLKDSFGSISGAVTATHTELNILDGATISTDRLNDIPIPDGTAMLFHQASAPTGWTGVSSSVNDRALRVVNPGSTGGSGGGGQGFATVFVNNRTTSSDGAHDHGGATGGHSLTVAEMPAHTHTMAPTLDPGNSFGGGGSGSKRNWLNSAETTSSTGSGDAHTHTIASAGAHTHTTNLNVWYRDVIIATKDAV